MEPAVIFDASVYHQFPNYSAMEQDYMRFLYNRKRTHSTHDKKDSPVQEGSSSLANEIQKVRESIKSSLETAAPPGSAPPNNRQLDRLEKVVNSLVTRVQELEATIERLKSLHLPSSASTHVEATKPAAPAKEADDNDDDVDFFASDEDDEEHERLKQERVAAYNARKANKVKEVAKSSIVLDIKPWDDTTNMQELEALVRGVKCDGLLWGASKLVPVVASIKKLQIACVVEDDKVSLDFLEETITGFTDHVQSVDIASFNKL
uniref:Elongation factor 1-beta n=2 Tax=Schistocephalus solidus TaxID=70667 RepID=A0A0V0J5H2_SCHSO